MMRKLCLLAAATATLALPSFGFAADAPAPDLNAWAKAATDSGLTCNLGPLKKREETAQRWVIEFRCADKDDGRLAVFPKTPDTASIVYDCVTAKVGGFACADTKENAAYAAINADIRKFDYRSECRASSTRMMALTQNKKTAYLEIKCDNANLSGQILQFDTATLKAMALIDCEAAANMAGGCRLTATKQRDVQALGQAGVAGVTRNPGGIP